jgi:hypothetical protein
MNVEKPPLNPRRFERRPDDVDGLLRAFFRAKMPDPWPALKVPARPVSRPLPSSRRRPWWGSRFALAATVALCLAGSALLAGLFPASGPVMPSAPSKDRSVISKVEPFTVKTPSGRTVKGWEKNEGKKTTIRVEIVDTPLDGE